MKDCKYYTFINFCTVNVERELKKKQLKEFILNLAESLDDTNYFKDVYKFEDNGWIIEISFFAEIDKYSKDIIAFTYPPFFPKGDYKYVQKSLKKKASKYGKLELPYILATCYYEGNVSLNEVDLINALLGNQVYIPELRETIRQKNGLWYFDKNNNNSKNKTLSGVLYFNTFRSNNSFYSRKPKLFRNPWGQNPILLEEVEVENVDLEIKYIKD